MKSILVLVVLFYAHLSFGDNAYQHVNAGQFVPVGDGNVMLVGIGGGYQCMSMMMNVGLNGGGTFMVAVDNNDLLKDEAQPVFVTPEGRWLCLNEGEQGLNFTECDDAQISLLKKACDGDGDGGDDSQSHTAPVLL